MTGEDYKPGFAATQSMARLNTAQSEAAYRAGIADGQAETGLATVEQMEYNNAKRKAEVANNGETGLHLREGGERYDRSDTGGQVSELEEGAGRDQGRNVQRGPADGEAADLSYEGEGVSSKDIGVIGGFADDKVYLVKSGSTAATREAEQVAKKRGLKIVMFGGGDIHTADAPEGANGYYDPNTGTMYVRTDDPDFTAAQLAKHEAGHDMIAKGEVNIAAVRKRCEDAAPNGNVEELARRYENAYAGIGEDAEYAWEECICDALGDMNVFGNAIESRRAEFADAMEQIRSATEETRSARGPPTNKTGGKYSGDRRAGAQTEGRDSSSDERETGTGDRAIDEKRSGVLSYLSFGKRAQGQLRQAVLASLRNGDTVVGQSLIREYGADGITQMLFDDYIRFIIILCGCVIIKRRTRFSRFIIEPQ